MAVLTTVIGKIAGGIADDILTTTVMACTCKILIAPPMFVDVIPVTSAQEMFEKVATNASENDIIIKAAAVADYRPKEVYDEKIKKSDRDAVIELKRTTDILAYLGQNKGKTYLCGFSMETENMLENSRKKLDKKNLDMIVANNLKEKGAGFGVDTNLITIITRDRELQLELMSKQSAANCILDEIIKEIKNR